MINKPPSDSNSNSTNLLLREETTQPMTSTPYKSLLKSSEHILQGGLRTQGHYKKSCQNRPLITIITAVYNGASYLEKTILSILNQDYENVEYIIIDGGSTDGTLDILKKYDDQIDYWISEKDKGISDAFNKGIQLSTGDYINFQGDGDGFCNEHVLSQTFKGININEDILISTRIQRIDIDDNILFTSQHIHSFNKSSLLFKMSLPHQGLFTHKKYFEQYGLFDVDNVFCMDYEHLLRSYHNFPEVITKNIVVAKWRADGLGNGRTLEIFDEYDKIKNNHKVASTLFLKYIKYWTLLKYYVKRVFKLEK